MDVGTRLVERIWSGNWGRHFVSRWANWSRTLMHTGKKQVLKVVGPTFDFRRRRRRRTTKAAARATATAITTTTTTVVQNSKKQNQRMQILCWKAKSWKSTATIIVAFLSCTFVSCQPVPARNWAAYVRSTFSPLEKLPANWAVQKHEQQMQCLGWGC